MISREYAKKEIGRLSGTNYFPMRAEALSELVNALILSARSKEHATMAISSALDGSTNCPTPADIKRLCVESGEKSQDYPPPCDQCMPFGGNWAYGERLFKGQVVTALTRCSCSRGRLLRTREDAEKNARK